MTRSPSFIKADAELDIIKHNFMKNSVKKQINVQMGIILFRRQRKEFIFMYQWFPLYNNELSPFEHLFLRHRKAAWSQKKKATNLRYYVENSVNQLN